MPQHVTIQIQDGPKAKLTTSNCGQGTAYDIYWQGERIANGLETGVATQRKAEDRNNDSRCDFTHARRAIAALGCAADTVIKELQPEEDLFKGATLLLHTNQIERGKIIISPHDSTQLSIEVQIGTSQQKLHEQHPKQLFRGDPYIVPKPDSQSRMELVLRVIAAECSKILDMLAVHKLPGSATP